MGLRLCHAGVVDGARCTQPMDFAVLEDVSLCSRTGMQHFDCLQLEFFHKQIWGCFIGGCPAEAKMCF